MATAFVLALSGPAIAQVAAPEPAPATVAEPLPVAEGVALDWPELDWPVVESSESADGEQVIGEVRYTVEIEGLEYADLDDQFRGLSSLVTGAGRPANLPQINRRVTEARDLIDLLMRSKGYYGSNTIATVSTPASASDAVRVVLKVEPGPLYTFKTVTVQPPASPESGPTSESGIELAESLLDIKPGAPVVAETVTASGEVLAAKLGDAGYPFPQISPPEVVIDHATRTADLTQTVRTGPRGVFGETRIEGEIQGFTPEHMQVMTRFKPGEPYDGKQREDLRQALVRTGLFGAVSVGPVLSEAPAPEGSQTIDMVATVEAAPVRTVSGLGGYYTGQGIRLEGSWAHRNLFPPEGALTTSAVAAQREQRVGAQVSFSNWRKRDQSLILLSDLSDEQQFAFKARSARVGVALQRESNLIWQKPVTYSVGAEFLVTRQLDRSAERTALDANATYFIFALPSTITFDRSNDLLDPTKGFRLTTRVSPEFTLRQGQRFNYVKLQLDATLYQPLAERIVVAGRLHVGTIAGANRGRVAPNRRFYAGGGGSVRGFNFQGVGPQDIDGNPTGGNSLTEASIEARFRSHLFEDSLGFVGFVDAGQVSPGTLPSFRSLAVGAGVGVRYYTAFGPVRIDIATPITNRRFSPRVAFYVSIGQAF